MALGLFNPKIFNHKVFNVPVVAVVVPVSLPGGGGPSRERAKALARAKRRAIQKDDDIIMHVIMKFLQKGGNAIGN